MIYKCKMCGGDLIIENRNVLIGCCRCIHENNPLHYVKGCFVMEYVSVVMTV